MKITHRNKEYPSIRDCLKANKGTVDSYKYYRRQGCSRRQAINKACRADEESQYVTTVSVNGNKVKIQGNYDVVYGVARCVELLTPLVEKYVFLEQTTKEKQ